MRHEWSEIADACHWYESQREGLGGDFLHSLDETLQQFHRDPTRYPFAIAQVRRALLRRFPYGVFFAEFDEDILIAAVVHARRDPGNWPSRPAR